jgi:hypothetical protein
MTNTTTVASTLEPPQLAVLGKLAGPPGVLFFVATVGAIVLAIDTNTRQALWLLLSSVPIWLGLAGVWGVRFLMALRETRARMGAAH